MIHISATNRGSKRIESDFYATPKETIENFLDNYPTISFQNVLEPCAGNGSIVKALRNYGRHLSITSNEIREEEIINLKTISEFVYNEDFLTFVPKIPYGTIITNPPFSIAQQIIEHCFEIANKETEIIMLLRLAFLESKKRHDFWQKHPVNKLYVLSERPSFTGHGTDATAYAWFVWDDSEKQEIKVI